VALMCLAEALLRVPDDDTADRLIAEKIRSGDWDAHAGRSRSNFVNASVWGLMLTGRLVTLDPATYADTGAWIRRLVSRLGEPVVRTAVLQAMRILGGQYVLGRSVEEALERGRELNDPGTRFSFDMLGEGARTQVDADRYFAAYRDAIESIGRHEAEQDPILANGVSIKLSALHPRYEFAQWARVLDELLPRLKQLAIRARRHGLGLSIDAEEAARLEPSLDLFERLALDPALRGWEGLGFVLQAYLKRAPGVVDWLIDLTGRADRRIMVRLVKGAYWDTEIKHAQEQGFPDYPVYTRKANTDLCYEVCAARLLQQDRIFPQFATHNANTVSTIIELAGARRSFEFQRLHGMGQLLYRKLFESREQSPDTGKQANNPARPHALRVYAPVGSHRDLLPYLVRRLLENGANSSFVNRFLDAGVPVDELTRDVTSRIDPRRGLRHPLIPAPPRLYRHRGDGRDNAAGIDLDDPGAVEALMRALADHANQQAHAAPIVNGTELSGTSGKPGTSATLCSPADRARSVGTLVEAVSSDVDAALDWASRGQPTWDALGGIARARILERAARLLESRTAAFMTLIIREAGRTVHDALSEVREAIDFCRYYAAQARELFSDPVRLPGPTGECSELSLCGRGTFVCISPWNFPLAIF
ncbi:MAG: bifunctional proline dehydrogenase/L-glutamate gamma-semialdehyde dehydrogenase PutA, partial [Pseudomonadales bacterium]|nr:bifunctional proline dehydrogenase/L-glutamate gamma-semialdehyde dehydrogenase PutA [Pseudomonadales bacterium]